MNKTIIFKGFALTNFIGLLTLFLLFRNGLFDKYFDNDKNMTSTNGGTPTKMSKDQIIQKKDSLHRQRFYSSKSLILIDNLKPDKDTSIVATDSIPINEMEEEKHFMYSSKSAIIFEPKTPMPFDSNFKTKNPKEK